MTVAPSTKVAASFHPSTAHSLPTLSNLRRALRVSSKLASSPTSSSVPCKISRSPSRLPTSSVSLVARVSVLTTVIRTVQSLTNHSPALQTSKSSERPAEITEQHLSIRNPRRKKTLELHTSTRTDLQWTLTTRMAFQRQLSFPGHKSKSSREPLVPFNKQQRLTTICHLPMHGAQMSTDRTG